MQALIFSTPLWKGNAWVACACNILNISDVDGQIILPSQLLKEDLQKKKQFVEDLLVTPRLA